jgi:hypothetical protein
MRRQASSSFGPDIGSAAGTANSRPAPVAGRNAAAKANAPRLLQDMTIQADDSIFARKGL